MFAKIMFDAGGLPMGAATFLDCPTNALIIWHLHSSQYVCGKLNSC